MRTTTTLRLVAWIGAATLAVSGCSGSGSGTAADADGATRTVTGTVRGDVKDVPVKPKRILALWRTGSELVDLGVTPVGQLDGELLESELGDQYTKKVASVPKVGTFEGVDLEKVIALKPDLIVGMDHGGLSIDYDELEEVAPTVVLKIAEPTDVWDNYPKLADVVGRKTDFEDKDAALTKKLKAIDAEHGDTLGRLKVTSLGAEADGSILWVDTSKSLTYRRLTTAGFGYNAAYVKNPERYVTELSKENLPDLADQDVIFYDATIDGKPTEGIAPTLASASFKRLPAYKAGHVFPLTSGIIYTFDAGDLQVRDLLAAARKLEASS